MEGCFEAEDSDLRAARGCIIMYNIRSQCMHWVYLHPVDVCTYNCRIRTSRYDESGWQAPDPLANWRAYIQDTQSRSDCAVSKLDLLFMIYLMDEVA